MLPHLFSNYQGASMKDLLKYMISIGEYYLPRTQVGEFPYFNIFPQFVSTVVPGGAKVTWKSACFQKNEAWAQINQDKSVTLFIDSSGYISFKII
jgi:hypothetical protein